MAAGVTAKLWEFADMVRVLEEWEIGQAGSPDASRTGQGRAGPSKENN